MAFVHLVTKDAEMVEVAFKGKEMEFTEEHEIAGDGNKEWPDAFPKNDADKTIQAVNKEHKQVFFLKSGKGAEVQAEGEARAGR